MSELPLTDEQFVNYCEIHCQTQRALFSGRDINRMLDLARGPDEYIRYLPADEWFSVHEEMQELVDRARELHPELS